MSLQYRVLGAPGRDNALLVHIDSGQGVERLLFDCGEGCLSTLSYAEIADLDHLFFSHLHMDHVGGFDTFFRSTFNRETKPNRIWGPPGTAEILQHRFRGFLWNLHGEMTAAWRVTDIAPAQLQTTRFELREAFVLGHAEGVQSVDGIVHRGEGYAVEALTMDHRTPSLAFVVREHPRRNVDLARLAALGLHPGAWMKELKNAQSAVERIHVDGVERSLAELRAQLVVETPGPAVAYLSDFLLDEASMELLGERLRGVRTLVCEAQYRHADLDLAQRNFHLTSVLAAQLAARAQVGELVLFHLSDRYERADWLAMLREAREIFPAARFPENWLMADG